MRTYYKYGDGAEAGASVPEGGGGEAEAGVHPDHRRNIYYNICVFVLH